MPMQKRKKVQQGGEGAPFIPFSAVNVKPDTYVKFFFFHSTHWADWKKNQEVAVLTM